MKHLIMGTAGHVDHGKTSLIKALTNIDCDTHKEEKERGITINLGFSHIDLPSGNSVGIIDVPGHKDFINTMVGGACGIDFVLLVIAADSGIMPQTKEHFNIIQALKVKRAIIVLNKIDLVDEELAELAKMEVMEWLEDTEFQDSPIVGVSSHTGQGLPELTEVIEKMIPQISEKKKDNFFRMFVDRIFTVKGMGSVVTGSVLNGEVNIGQDLFLLPGRKQKLRIRSIERHGKTAENVISGDRAAFNLTGLKTEDFKRGMLLSDKEMESTTMIDAYITLFENSSNIGVWSTNVFHSGTFESQGRMHLLNKDTIKPGEEAIVQIILEKESVLINKDKFIIRNSSGDKSIGGGIIIDAQPLHHRKRTTKLIQSLDLLSQGILNEGKTAELIKIELLKEGLPLQISEIASRLNISIEDAKEEIEILPDILSYIGKDGDILIASMIDDEIQKQIITFISDHHQKNIIFSEGLEEVELYGKLAYSSNKTAKNYLGLLLKKMHLDDKIKPYKNTWALFNHQAKMDDKTKANIDWLEGLIKSYGDQKPAYKDILEAVKNRKIKQDQYKIYIGYLSKQGLLIHYKNEYVHSSVIDENRRSILQFLNKKEEGVFTQELREASPLSKKMIPFVIGLLEAEKVIITSDYNKNNYLTKITDKGRGLL